MKLWARRLPLVLALSAVVVLWLSGLGTRKGWWHFRIGFQLLRDAAFVGAAAAVLAAAFLLVPKMRFRNAAWLALALVLGAGVFAIPYRWMRLAKDLPLIHDITTDTQDPPKFAAILPLRKDAKNPAEYGGPEIARQQKAAYPDIQPLVLSESPVTAFSHADDAARAMEWEIVRASSPAGPIEATDTTRFFGFKDDIVVRISPAGTGSRVDVRSVSRVGKSDVGKNAERIRRYLALVKAKAK